MLRLTPRKEKRRIAEQTSALHEAAALNLSDLVVDLLDRDPSQVDVRDHNDRTPLHRACGRGHHGTASVLLALKADPNATDKHGQSALHWAVFAGCEVTIEVLLAMGARPTLEDTNGRTAAHIAIAKGTNATLKQLLRAGASDPGLDWPGPGRKWSLKSFWTDDLETSECMCCRKRSFSMQVRRHHCRQCGDVICRSCGVKAKPPWHTPTEKSELVCVSCTKVWATEDKSKGIYTSQSGADAEILERDFQLDDFDELKSFFWFYDSWIRVDAERGLSMDGVLPGDFVCRPSSYPDSIALSTRTEGGSVQHFLIQYVNGGFFLKIPGATGRYTSFDTVVELLRYYMASGFETAEGEILLTRPYISLDDLPPHLQRGDLLSARRKVVAESCVHLQKTSHKASSAAASASGPADSDATDSPQSLSGSTKDSSALPRHDSKIIFVADESSTLQRGVGADALRESEQISLVEDNVNGGAHQVITTDTAVWDTCRSDMTNGVPNGSEDVWGEAGSWLDTAAGMKAGPDAAIDGDGYDSGSYYEGSGDDGEGDGAADLETSGAPSQSAKGSERIFSWSWLGTGMASLHVPPEIDESPPTFPEPEFAKTGIPDVDDRIREGILKGMAEQYAVDLAQRLATRERTISDLTAQREILKEAAVSEIIAAAETTDAMPLQKSLCALTEVLEAAEEFLTLFGTPIPSQLDEHVEKWRDERERRAVEVNTELQRECKACIDEVVSAFAEAEVQRTDGGPVTFDAIRSAVAEVANFKAIQGDSLSNETEGELDNLLSEWAATENELVEWEDGRARREKERVRAATVIQAGLRGMIARRQTRSAMAAFAAVRADLARARADQRKDFEEKWSAAEGMLDAESRTLQQEAILAAAMALPALSFPDRQLEAMVESWSVILEEARREKRILLEKDKVRSIIERGQGASKQPLDVDALCDIIDEARTCEMTGDLKMYLDMWDRTVSSWNDKNEIQAVLELGYRLVPNISVDGSTADSLKECIRKARALPENEILSGAISSWEQSLREHVPHSDPHVSAERLSFERKQGLGQQSSPARSKRWFKKDFLFDIQRDVAESCLRNRSLDTGAFIVRQSSTYKGQYTLSVRSMDVTKHFRLNTTKEGKYLLRGSKLAFDSLAAVLHNYTDARKNDILPTTLRKPCPRKIVEAELAKQKIRLCDKCNRSGKTNDGFCQFCGSKYAHPLMTVKSTDTRRPDSWELKRSTVQFQGLLGMGNFGEVRQGLLGGRTEVAIKTSKADKMSTKTFLEEAQKMKKLLHPNLCRMWGVCTLKDPVLMVLEYVGGGCLQDWLHSRRGRGLSVTHQCKFLADVSSGMAFMQDRHWVHGDLAARNILVSSSGKTLKICDFGHAVRCNVDDELVRIHQQLPVRWCAPEFFRSRKCNPSVDVWSFGVVVFEVLTRALEPYADIIENKEVVAKLETGWRMPRVKQVHAPFYDMMLDCWQDTPSQRPRFSHLYSLCKQWEQVGHLRANTKGDLIDHNGSKVLYKSGLVCGDKVPTPPDPEIMRPDARATKA